MPDENEVDLAEFLLKKTATGKPRLCSANCTIGKSKIPVCLFKQIPKDDMKKLILNTLSSILILLENGH